MNKQLLKDGLGWGFILWLIGYALGIAAFAVVPAELIGWVIMPIGIVMTLWVALRMVKGDTLQHFVAVGFMWLSIAVVGDYLLIVKAFNPTDGNYKLDVYIYYALTVAIPVIAGWRRTTRRS